MTSQACAPEDASGRWALPADEVHVWRASLERRPHAVGRMRSLLASDEQRRADQFRFERDRARYIVGRALLRILLARYLETAAAGLEFEYGEFRKPGLRDGPWFNLSHSGPVALYAFSSACEVGVDIELDEPDFARERIAERFFSRAEVSVLRSLPLEVQPRAFLTCWTRKEAFIKARGDGLSLRLDSFDVTLAPGTPAALLRTAWCSEEPKQWRLQDLSDRRAGYIAAVALRSHGWRVVEREIMENMENPRAA
jgi:4'-phosphopantetheinyl transferase